MRVAALRCRLHCAGCARSIGSPQPVVPGTLLMDGDFGLLMPDSRETRKPQRQGAPRAAKPHSDKPTPMAEHVGESAWAGQHAQAIELAMEALAAIGLSTQ